MVGVITMYEIRGTHEKRIDVVDLANEMFARAAETRKRRKLFFIYSVSTLSIMLVKWKEIWYLLCM